MQGAGQARPIGKDGNARAPSQSTSRALVMSSLAQSRLAEEEKAQGPPPGFFARPEKTSSGEVNMFKWKCIVPGPKDTLWSGAFIPLTMDFRKEYPAKPMKCKFPGILPSQHISERNGVSEHFDEDEGWKPSVSVKQVLMGIQELLDNPNENRRQSEAYARTRQIGRVTSVG